LVDSNPGADGERDRHQHAEQQGLQADHGVTPAGWLSKRARLRPRMMAISLSA
jgi:hypothetical protein